MGGRSSSSKGKESSGKGGRSSTKDLTQGKEALKFDPKSLERAYLCIHMCVAMKVAKKSKNGKNLYQDTMTAAIQLEAAANFGVWRYLAEVGYDMSFEYPKPLMSPEEIRMHLPSSFPLGRAKQLIEDYTKGLLRIPDVTILKVTSAELHAMRMKGIIDWPKLYPRKDTIDKIVEVKFYKDLWRPDQLEDYQIINPNVYELHNSECFCDRDKDKPKNPPNYPVIQNPYPYKNRLLKPVIVNQNRTSSPGIFGWMNRIGSAPQKELEQYRKLVPLEDMGTYKQLVVPFMVVGAGVAGGMICGSVVVMSGGAVGAMGTLGSEATSGLAITGFTVWATN